MEKSKLKIAVLGGRGHLGSQIIHHLQDRYQCLAVNRNDLDLRDFHSVKQYLQHHGFDIVINCATAGCRQWNSDNQNYEEAQNNLEIFTNLVCANTLYHRLINIGSGAEFDLRYDISNVSEEQIFSRYPSDSYGWSKNIISRLCTGNAYTLRLFGCFASNESDFRLLARVTDCAYNRSVFRLNSDRYFDYISMDDFCMILEHYINAPVLEYQDINCVYDDKILLSEFVKKFCNLQNLDMDFLETATQSGLNYTGDSSKLSSLKLPLTGLEQGLRQYVR